VALPANAPLYQIVEKKALQALLEGESQWPWYGQLMRKPQTIAFFLQVDAWLRQYQIDILL
jgi:asparagine synthase (glutamine-hydrolysing)